MRSSRRTSSAYEGVVYERAGYGEMAWAPCAAFPFRCAQMETDLAPSLSVVESPYAHLDGQRGAGCMSAIVCWCARGTDRYQSAHAGILRSALAPLRRRRGTGPSLFGSLFLLFFTRLVDTTLTCIPSQSSARTRCLFGQSQVGVRGR
jgi:hypothetical protein